MMIGRSFKRRMPIAWDRDWCMIYLQTEGIKERNSALDQSPEQSLNSALKINNDQLHLLQLLLLACYLSFVESLGDKGPFARAWRCNLLGQEIRQGFKHGDSNLSGFSQLLDHHAAVLVNCSGFLADLL
ncbi:hypothetical protein C2845_PM11G14690 [Panicum miliaceum]|uniref:Uncharacterized protein n=1 Tax=Panicum miliaceum TaxID=4540 RepID=A0A3L6RSD0_PANMI|nr:hypothetical protein C2845_PM11G14690 [Panicum miliaceum]